MPDLYRTGGFYELRQYEQRKTVLKIIETL